MPVKTTARVTHADYQKLKDEAAALKGEVTRLKKELASEKSDANTLRTQLASADQVVSGLQTELAEAKDRASQLTQATEALHTAAAPAVDSSNEPRYLWAIGEASTNQLFDNLAAAEAAKKARPGYWFDDPGAAQAAWHAAQLEHLAGDTAEDDGQTPAEATT